MLCARASLGSAFDEPNGEGVRVVREGSRLRLWNNGVRDRVATHLVSSGGRATLPHPLLLRNHQDQQEVEIGNLAWQGWEGESVSAPKADEAVSVVTVPGSVRPQE